MVKILIVDDEPDIRFMMRLILEGAGHKVTEARNGAIGLKSARATPPDLLITDVMMPVMDGLELITCLRSDPETASIPILVVSGNSELATAADALLAKPFLPKALLLAAASLTRRAKPVAEGRDGLLPALQLPARRRRGTPSIPVEDVGRLSKHACAEAALARLSTEVQHGSP